MEIFELLLSRLERNHPKTSVMLIEDTIHAVDIRDVEKGKKRARLIVAKPPYTTVFIDIITERKNLQEIIHLVSTFKGEFNTALWLAQYPLCGKFVWHEDVLTRGAFFTSGRDKSFLGGFLISFLLPLEARVKSPVLNSILLLRAQQKEPIVQAIAELPSIPTPEGDLQWGPVFLHDIIVARTLLCEGDFAKKESRISGLTPMELCLSVAEHFFARFNVNEHFVLFPALANMLMKQLKKSA